LLPTRCSLFLLHVGEALAIFLFPESSRSRSPFLCECVRVFSCVLPPPTLFDAQTRGKGRERQGELALGEQELSLSFLYSVFAPSLLLLIFPPLSCGFPPPLFSGCGRLTLSLASSCLKECERITLTENAQHPYT